MNVLQTAVAQRSLHHRAFLVSVLWTLGLLYLGSVVHATESSLACPDWPTCFGSMMPEMTGGVFWEHLHRLVAGGLLLFFIATTFLAWKALPERPGVRYAALLGVVMLVAQSVLGGLTVLLQLPDAISTSHLALAFLFLGLATVLTVVTSPAWEERPRIRSPQGKVVRTVGMLVAVLVFGQSVLGGVVRHTDSGVACPDIPLCLGRWIPPLDNGLIATHFAHRVLGVVTALAVITLTSYVLAKVSAPGVRRLALVALLAVLAQVALGFASVYWGLAVAPVSLHTLVAAALFALSVAIASTGWRTAATLGNPARDILVGSAG